MMVNDNGNTTTPPPSPSSTACCRVESLQKLAAKVVMKRCNYDLRQIKNQVKVKFSKRKKTFWQLVKEEEMAEYLKRKYSRIDVQHLNDLVLEEGKNIIGYCEKCECYYPYGNFESNQCSAIDGCEYYSKCFNCHIRPFVDKTKDVYDKHVKQRYDMLEEQTQTLCSKKCAPSNTRSSAPPYWNGIESCWICQNEYCMYHFVEHYKACRKNASHKCGFRGGSSKNNRDKCVEGHCGRDMREVDNGVLLYCCVLGSSCCRDCCTNGIHLEVASDEELLELCHRRS